MSTKKTKIETKKIKRFLRVNLTKDELLDAGKNQADKLQELGRLENDQKRVAMDFKAKISALEADTHSLSNKISTGYEFRDVTCTAFLGDPKPEKKRIVRDDTNEQVGIEDMSAEEMQRELINSEELKP